MRVLQLGKFYDPVVGGMETILRDICENLHTQVQFQVVVANTKWRTVREHRKFPVTKVASMGTLFSCSMAPTFPLRMRKLDADLIQVHLPNPLAEMSLLIAGRDIPIVAHFHSDIVRQQRLLKVYRPFLESFYRRVSRIVVPTPRHVDISPFVSKHRNKCNVVPFGIPLSRFELTETGRKKVDKLRDGPPGVLYVGRLVSYKGLEFLIRAMADSKARVWIIGTGPMESALKDLAHKLGMEDKVEFLGHVSTDDLVAYYHACEVFVLPSVTNAEMFGIVQLEAMACYKPVISTNLMTGVSWVNQHGITGCVVPPGDTAALANSIEHLLANSELRQEMGAAGRSRVERHFTSAKMAAGMLEVYRDVLEQSKLSQVPTTMPHRPPTPAYEPVERAG